MTAPQAENDDDYESPDECPACDMSGRFCNPMSVCCEDCDHAAGAPALPSSTVDEDALAEVIREAEQSWHLSDEKSQQSYACGAPDLKSKYIARAVAEWLREQGGQSRG